MDYRFNIHVQNFKVDERRMAASAVSRPTSFKVIMNTKNMLSYDDCMQNEV